MKFLSGLFGKKAQAVPEAVATNDFDVEVEAVAAETVSEPDMAIVEAAAEAAKTPEPEAPVTLQEADEDPSDVGDLNLDAVETVLETVGKSRADSVNIWDLDAEDDEVAAEAEAEAERASARARRNRTRLIGFDKSDGDVVDLFNGSQATKIMERAKFPVGWVLVVEGPGRGECFSLTAGMAQIGRGDDQAIQLDFGDNAISRNNHAAIVYDPAGRKFLLGHGGKANIVRLNGKPVISNEDITDGDRITLGETTLMLKTLCGADFDWEDTAGGEEQDDVAIA